MVVSGLLLVNKRLFVAIYSQKAGYGWGSCGGSCMHWPSTSFEKIMVSSPMICQKIQYIE